MLAAAFAALGIDINVQYKSPEWYERKARRAAEAKVNAVQLHARRRAQKQQRYPAWACRSAITAVYREAARVTAATGVPHEVDHVIPLRGKLVSGLHVAGNLRIITRTENARKRNKFEV